MSDPFEDLIGQVDVAFVVDTTGSMGPFINAARRHIRAIAEEIGRKGALDLRFALIEYRDHPPEETSFVTRSYPFGDGEALQHVMEGLVPDGGGDAPEAVLDGLIAAVHLQWRPNADRLCYLVGDAPPHGATIVSELVDAASIAGDSVASGRRVPHASTLERMGDRWPKGCPCRATPNGVVELLHGHRIRLHAIALVREPLVVAAFRDLAEGAGGSLTVSDEAPEAAVVAMAAPLARTSDMVASARLYASAAEAVGSSDPAAVAPAMGVPKEAAEGIAAYLHERGLFKEKS